MADRRIRDLRRLLQAVAEAYGAAVVVEQTRGNHLRGTFVVGNRQAFIVASWWPHASRQVEADARRKLRELMGAS
jgi:hypothetical protein